MEIRHQVAYMSPRPSPDSDEAQLRALCLSLNNDLEVVANLISRVTQRQLEADECDQYLETARAAIDRIRRIVLKNC
jgi:hypothetical protein